jgi:hypothetical protein
VNRGPESRPRAVAAALLVLALAVGMLTGIAVDRLVLLPRGLVAGEVAPPAAPGEANDGWHRPRPAGDRYLDFMVRELELSAEQRRQIETILQRQQERVQEITRDTRPQIHAVARETRASIDEVLTPAQRERFKELRARRDAPPPRHRRDIR